MRAAPPFQIDTLKSTVADAVETLAQTTLTPKLIPWEIEDAAKVLQTDLEELGSNHQAYVQELMHPAAYGSLSALGKPLYAKASGVKAINGDVLGDFLATQCGRNSHVSPRPPPRWQCPSFY